MNESAIVEAVRGVIRGELGSVRTVPADTFGDGMPASWLAMDSARRLRTGVKSTFDVEIDPAQRTAAVGPPTASLSVEAIRLTITLTYALAAVADAVTDDYRHGVRTGAAADARTIRLALEWPGNLLVDGDANATGLISGRLQAQGPARRKREDWDAGLYELELIMSGHALASQAVA